MVESGFDSLTSEIERLVLGKKLPSCTCDCGLSSHAEAEAVSLHPPRNFWNTKEIVYWRVAMREYGKCVEESYTCGISRFISEEDFMELIAEYLPNVR